MKNYYTNSYMNILTGFFHQNSVDFEKVIALALSNGYTTKNQRIEEPGRRIWGFFH